MASKCFLNVKYMAWLVKSAKLVYPLPFYNKKHLEQRHEKMLEGI